MYVDHACLKMKMSAERYVHMDIHLRTHTHIDTNTIPMTQKHSVTEEKTHTHTLFPCVENDM